MYILLMQRAQSAMADVSLWVPDADRAMLGSTAADHERISKSHPDRLRVTTTYHQSAPPEDATSRIDGFPKSWEIHFTVSVY